MLALFRGIKNLLSALMSVFPSVPQIPANVDSFITQLLGYISAGFGILAQFCFWDIVKDLAVVSLALFIAYRAYQFILWVVKKIPVVGIE